MFVEYSGAKATHSPRDQTRESSPSLGSKMASNGEVAKPVIMNEEELKRKQREKLKKLQATGGNPRPARTLFLFGLKNPFRNACTKIVEWKYPSSH